MLSRALSLATVTLLISCFAALPARAQNLEAGKTPAQIFDGSCTACHKAPRGLLKSVPAGSLPGFLRQHYTTSSEMASRLSAYLISHGATDQRYVGIPPKQGADAKPEANSSGTEPQLNRNGRPSRAAAPAQEASRPDADGLSPRGEPGGRQGRNAKRLNDPSVVGPGMDGAVPAQATSERGPDGRKLSAKQRLGNRGKPGTETPPKTDPVKEETSHGDLPKEGIASSPAQPADGKTAAVRPELPIGEGASNMPLRTDPVPTVTPAPTAPESQIPPVQTNEPGPSAAPTSAASAPPPTTTASSTAAEPATGSSPSRPSVPPPISAASAASAPTEHHAPAGPPSPPISQ